MKFSKVRIESLAWVKPPVEVSSADIEQRLAPAYERLHLPAGRLELMTGIKSRHFWERPVLASYASAQAGAKILAKTGIPKERIGMLAHCGVCRDRMEPATASYVHDILQLGPRTQILDVSNACLGFLNGMLLAAGLIESGQIESALIVTGEDGSPLLESTIRQFLDPSQTRNSVKSLFANLTIGAGAAAAMLCHESLAPKGIRLKAAVVETDTSANRLCQGGSSGDGLEMATDSEALLEAGLKVASRAWASFCDETGWSADTPDRVVCHQVGRVHQRRLLESLGLDEAKDCPTYPFMGNTGSAAVPVTLAAAQEAGAIREGQKLAVLGIGSGLSSIMMALEA
ncbi:MAG: 3-oxoacyl-ACP synthase III [Opitutales bacterium]|nr:3-oxoacyl-ACP synthase III [Opitutales bacterium]